MTKRKSTAPEPLLVEVAVSRSVKDHRHRRGLGRDREGRASGGYEAGR